MKVNVDRKENDNNDDDNNSHEARSASRERIEDLQKIRHTQVIGLYRQGFNK